MHSLNNEKNLRKKRNLKKMLIFRDKPCFPIQRASPHRRNHRCCWPLRRWAPVGLRAVARPLFSLFQLLLPSHSGPGRSSCRLILLWPFLIVLEWFQILLFQLCPSVRILEPCFVSAEKFNRNVHHVADVQYLRVYLFLLLVEAGRKEVQLNSNWRNRRLRRLIRLSFRFGPVK